MSVTPAASSCEAGVFIVTGGICGGTVLVRDSNHVLRFSAQGLGVLQRAAAADQPEPGAVFAAGDDVRRRRPCELRTAELSGERANPCRGRPPPAPTPTA